VKLHLIPGHGRAFRFGHYIGFAHQPIADLTAVIGDPNQNHHEVFKRLAEFVVNRGYSVHPFTVISVGGSGFAAFAFGDIELVASNGTTIVDGSQSSSWCEIDMPEVAESGFSVGWHSEDFPAYGDCVLDTGMVAAGGFWFGTMSACQPTAIDSDGAATSIPPILNQAAQSTELKAYPPPHHPSAPARAVKSAQIKVPVSSATRPTLRPPSLASPEINLTEPTMAASDPDHTNQTPSIVGELCFDDGQVVPVSSTTYVGRFPTRSGIPTGCESVVVRGEHVSRVHWALLVDEQRRCIVKDLGSTGGTFVDDVQFQSQIPLRNGDEYLITSNTTVRFGDRWARFESARPTTKDHALRSLQQTGAFSG